MLVWTDALLRAAMQNLLLHAAAGPISGPLDGLEIALIEELANPINENTVIADITEPTFAGYARIPVAWGGIWERPDGGFQTTGQLAQFQQTATPVTVTIIGYALVTAHTGGLLRAAEMIAPVTLATLDHALLIAPQVVLGGDGESTAIVQGP